MLTAAADICSSPCAPAVTSRFFTDFFAFVKGKMPEVISLDAVKCEALSAVSMSYYLDYVSGDSGLSGSCVWGTALMPA